MNSCFFFSLLSCYSEEIITLTCCFPYVCLSSAPLHSLSLSVTSRLDGLIVSRIPKDLKQRASRFAINFFVHLFTFDEAGAHHLKKMKKVQSITALQFVNGTRFSGLLKGAYLPQKGT